LRNVPSNLNLETISIYTDGSCSPNPGKGGWGAVISIPTEPNREIFGGVKYTTNNKMEMTAVIEALGALPPRCTVILYTDSKYVMDGITKWIKSWKKNKWKVRNGSDVKNKDLWLALDAAAANHKIKWKWVKGHSGNVGNERADKLASIGAMEV